MSLRSHFPIFSHHPDTWTYLDSAATSQKPQVVIDRISQFFALQNANVHRATHEKSRVATQEYEQARKTVAKFVGARSASEIVWTKGATEAINLLSYSLTGVLSATGRTRILLSESEHHANIVPWQQLAARLGWQIDVIPVTPQGVWDVETGLSRLDSSVALIAIGHVSNALGNINPIAPFIAKAKDVGALTVVDGAQAVAHFPIDVQALDCDFYVFSGHKVFGPTGVGVLYGKTEWLNQMSPFQTGGEMIEQVTMQHSTFLPPPQRFETGTPNIAGVLGLASALNFVEQNRAEIASSEAALSSYLRTSLAQIDGLQVWGDHQAHVSTASFTLTGVDNQDLAILLDKQGVALRAGHHCTMPLMHALGLTGTLRASLGPYNTKADIDRLCEGIKQALATLGGSAIHHTEEYAENSAPTGTPITLGPLAQSVMSAKGWDQVYRQVMLAGKSLPRRPDIQQRETEVHGCESQVWVTVSHHNNRLTVEADSPSKVVRGLLAIMLEPLEDMPLDEVAQFELSTYLQVIGLSHHLSESRGNGLRAVWRKIIDSLSGD